METKANPNGCLADTMPGEPVFVLKARDACAPAAIRNWCELRAKVAVIGDGKRQDAEQLEEAFETADIMEAWRASNDGAWRNQRAPVTVLEAAYMVDSLLTSLIGQVSPGNDPGQDDIFATTMMALIDVMARKILNTSTPEIDKDALPSAHYLVQTQLRDRLIKGRVN